jgi:outer membrane lipoprotein SlyB
MKEAIRPRVKMRPLTERRPRSGFLRLIFSSESYQYSKNHIILCIAISARALIHRLMNKFTLYILLISALLLSTACQNNPNRGRDIGIVVGSILGGVAGAQMGDGSDLNILAGAAIGGALGGMGGNELDKRKEALEAAEVQRQYEYEQEVQAQESLEADIKTLEEKRIRDEIARKATSADVSAAEQEAARVEAQLAAKKKSYEESQARARRIQEAQERIAKAQQELAELERQENGG